MKLRSIFLLLLFAGAVWLGVFVMPWKIPQHTPVDSPSYIYGFHNLAACACIALLLGVLAGYFSFFRRGNAGGRWLETLANIMPDGEKVPLNKPLLISFLVLLVVTLVTVMAWFSYLPRAYFGETFMFLSRLDGMVLGLRPYRDMYFNYGPAMLYVPYCIYRLFHQQFSLEQAYGFGLVLHWGVGLWLVYYIVSRLKGAFPRTLTFLVLAIPSVLDNVVTLGPTYTFLRFTAPMASLIALHRLALRSAAGRPLQVLALAAAAFLAPCASFALSPEIGLAAWLGCAAYFVHLWWTPLRRLTVCVIAVALSLPALGLLFTWGYFDSIFSFSGGGNNLPIYPVPYIILFLAASFATVPLLAAIALRTSGPRGSIALGLCMILGLLIVPALGRCDPGHVLWNGFGILLLCLAALGQLNRIAFGVFGLVIAIIWGVLGFQSTWQNYSPLVQNQIRIHEAFEQNHVDQTVRSGPFHYSKMLPVRPEYQALLQYDKVGTPVGVEEDLERFLKLNGKFIPDHHLFPDGDVVGPSQLKRKLADMEAMRIIVIPAYFSQFLAKVNPEEQAKKDSAILSGIFGVSIKLQSRNPIFDPNHEMVTAIAAHYSVIGKATEGYLILQRQK